MMRYLCVTAMAAALFTAPALAQQNRQQPTAQQPAAARQPAAQQQPAARVARQSPPAGQQQAAASPNKANQQPFEQLAPAEQQRLQQFLLAWQKQSQGTRTLDLKFKRWHYDNKGAMTGIHATKAEGVIRYASPDKGLFRVDNLLFYNGMIAGKPTYKAIPGRFGEHWICNGTQLIEMDRSKEECEIQDLPPEMQGTQIFNSPLPFVFNLDAKQITQRYWVRVVEQADANIVLVEAWPKRQEDRAQYKLVQIALTTKSFLPQALVMYAPNFDPKTAPNKDIYEFNGVKRNAIGASLQKFVKNFIPQKPPKHWKIVHNTFNPVVEPPAQAGPGAQNARGPAGTGQPQTK